MERCRAPSAPAATSPTAPECTDQASAYPYPTDIHHAIGALAGLLEQLPRTLHQLAAGLNAIDPEHLAVLEDPPTPVQKQADAAFELGCAIAAIERAGTHLRQAQHTAAELVYTGPLPGVWTAAGAALWIARES
ncbi:hypothetical protein [Kitasatospora aureofaciens]|uniref:hypothetical protein n=1 Tax=Kitasatospora aureofaciens TaxID=1894 RepID=UPI00052713BB|nr:hypothetical protein [Kitasatospora aureofaciens]